MPRMSSRSWLGLAYSNSQQSFHLRFVANCRETCTRYQLLCQRRRDIAQLCLASRKPVPFDSSHLRSEFGIYTSAMDYAKFLSMWLNEGSFNNKQILSKRTINLAQSETVLHRLTAPHSHQSLAWRMLKPQTTSNSISYYLHGGSDGTMVFTYPKENTLALYFSQSRNHPRFIFENEGAV